MKPDRGGNDMKLPKYKLENQLQTSISRKLISETFLGVNSVVCTMCIVQPPGLLNRGKRWNASGPASLIITA